ncbi:unnamed protein product [Blepharisma stoltei]|uniref:Uncharacterized protein n=1 Tax=Blepharisma stoltei TaxID=1481888 RepID=A0AAU9J2C2_9CILI|nr:unnamed protein product [Blepharisma stoltei]
MATPVINWDSIEVLSENPTESQTKNLFEQKSATRESKDKKKLKGKPKENPKLEEKGKDKADEEAEKEAKKKEDARSAWNDRSW